MNLLQFLPFLVIAVKASPFEYLFNRDNRNGTIVGFDKYPYLVQVIVDCPSPWSAINLGVILSAEYVLSADSQRPKNCKYSVWVNQGDNNTTGYKLQVESRHINSTSTEYSDCNINRADVNLILFKLSRPINLGSSVQPIGILDQVKSGEQGTLIDLVDDDGYFDKTKIYEVNSTVLDALDCQFFGGTYVHWHEPAPNGTLCTIEPDADFPSLKSTILVVRGQLAGWQFVTHSFEHAGIFGLNLYTLLSKYKDWIKSYTGI